MPASASIHFCFHYASFLQSFQINFNASLNFKAYKKTLVLPNLVNWDLFRNLKDAFALVPGVTVSPACIQHVPGTISLKTSGPYPSTLQGSENELRFRCHTSALCCAGSDFREPCACVPMLDWLLRPGVVHQKPI